MKNTKTKKTREKEDSQSIFIGGSINQVRHKELWGKNLPISTQKSHHYPNVKDGAS